MTNKTVWVLYRSLYDPVPYEFALIAIYSSKEKAKKALEVIKQPYLKNNDWDESEWIIEEYAVDIGCKGTVS